MKDALDLIKTLFEVLKHILITFILVCLIFFQEQVVASFDKMNIQEVDLFGLKWKRKLVATDEALVTVRASAAELENQLKLAKGVIEEQQKILAQRGANDSADDPAARQAKASIATAKKTLAQSDQVIRNASTNAELADKAIVNNGAAVTKVEEAANDAPQWAIVAGGDSEEGAARHELRKARSNGYQSAKLFARLNSYRTVILFPDRSSAGNALAGVKSTMERPDAYVVNLDRWCPKREDTGNDIVTCPSDR